MFKTHLSMTVDDNDYVDGCDDNRGDDEYNIDPSFGR